MRIVNDARTYRKSLKNRRILKHSEVISYKVAMYEIQEKEMIERNKFNIGTAKQRRWVNTSEDAMNRNKE